ncbi:hypothetical protein GUJ93_ZPchr0012g20557 [Zizania palustris]|uniref:Uncharacterized protein n=1 Tax=Zizania palustris TaxID=103762 RepID=A0A8J5WJT6_ZIZPA|nr:hypothetical protein GUJ93_ZPchr0012g20557 [Zizania palustris]
MLTRTIASQKWQKPQASSGDCDAFSLGSQRELGSRVVVFDPPMHSARSSPSGSLLLKNTKKALSSSCTDTDAANCQTFCHSDRMVR